MPVGAYSKWEPRLDTVQKVGRLLVTVNDVEYRMDGPYRLRCYDNSDRGGKWSYVQSLDERIEDDARTYLLNLLDGLKFTDLTTDQLLQFVAIMGDDL